MFWVYFQHLTSFLCLFPMFNYFLFLFNTYFLCLFPTVDYFCVYFNILLFFVFILTFCFFEYLFHIWLLFVFSFSNLATFPHLIIFVFLFHIWLLLCFFSTFGYCLCLFSTFGCFLCLFTQKQCNRDSFNCKSYHVYVYEIWKYIVNSQCEKPWEDRRHRSQL